MTRQTSTSKSLATMIACWLLTALLQPAPASAQGCAALMDFETRSPGEIWTIPGQFMFYEDGIPAFTYVYDTGLGTLFGAAEITAPGIAGFGGGNAMTFENACNRYNVGALGLVVNQVRFEVVHFGQFVNLGANGYSVIVAPLAALDGVSLAPGVSVAVSTTPLPGGGEYGQVTVMGQVGALIFGADSGSLDNLCVDGHDAPSLTCHYLADHESQSLGTAWGGAHGDTDGDLIFTENDIEVSVRDFHDGVIPSLGEASIDNPYLPAGDHRKMKLDGIGVEYSIAHTLAMVAQVSFQFFDWFGHGTVENLEIDGLRYEGDLDDLPSDFFPGVTVNVSRVLSPPYMWGSVQILGDVREFTIGAQEMHVDNVCFRLDATVGVDDDGADVPQPSVIDDISPNPFNPQTQIRYSLRTAGPVRLTICDLAGRVVRTLVDESQAAGSGRSVTWDGRDESGRAAPAGIYLVRIVTPDGGQARKVALIK